MTVRKDVETAHRIAMDLVARGTDPNEVAKVATYARTHPQGAQLFGLVDVLVKDGRHLVRSGRTLDYYRDIRDVCHQHLAAYRNAQGPRAKELAQILGWTVRLMRYHKVASGRGEAVPPRRPEPSQASMQPTLKRGERRTPRR